MNNITLDECFQFGLGAFETIGIEKGTPILLEKHLKRLERAADFLKLGDPAVRGITAGRIEEYLEEQKKRPEVQKEFGGLEHCALKLMLTKENAVYSLRANHYTPENYEKGFIMDVSKVKRNETSPLVYKIVHTVLEVTLSILAVTLCVVNVPDTVPLNFKVAT